MCFRRNCVSAVFFYSDGFFKKPEKRMTNLTTGIFPSQPSPIITMVCIYSIPNISLSTRSALQAFCMVSHCFWDVGRATRGGTYIYIRKILSRRKSLTRDAIRGSDRKSSDVFEFGDDPIIEKAKEQLPSTTTNNCTPSHCNSQSPR